MNKHTFAALTLAGFGLAFALPGHAGSIAVDGNFSDWGISNNGTAAGWKPTSGIFYTVEDQDNSNSGYLSPGWGGQAYDAEALYATWSTHANGQTYLDIALITGHDPSTVTNGSTSFGRGDFAIDFGRDGSWDYGILTADRSTTLHQGDVVATTNADWAKGLWTAPGVYDPAHSQYITAVKTGTDVGDAALAISTVFTNMGVLGGNHWFYELEIPVTAFGQHWTSSGPTEAFTLEWTMLCSNDIITLDPSRVPEPATAALLLGALGVLGAVRRQRR